MSGQSPPADTAETVRIGKSVVFFLPAVYIVIHTLEELPGFGAWVETYFGSHPTGMFAAQHILIWLLVFFISYKAYRAQRHGAWVILATAAQIQFGVNALFHLTTFIMFQAYSPGVITGTAIAIPSTILYLRFTKREARINDRELAWATLWGVLIAAAAISVLFIGS